MSKKKKTVLIVLAAVGGFVLLCALLIQAFLFWMMTHGLGGSGDWAYTDLPGEYEIWRINGKNISLIKKTSEYGGDNIVGPYIAAFCRDRRYIGLQRTDGPAGDTQEDAAPEYYIVDSADGSVYGPFSSEEYAAQCEALGFRPDDWIRTVPTPEGAEY